LMYFCKALLAGAYVPQGTLYILAMYVTPFVAATWLSLKCEPLKFVMSDVLKAALKKGNARKGHAVASDYRITAPLATGDIERRTDV